MAKFSAGYSGMTFRFKRGPNKFGNSWDAERHAEREKARRRARDDKDARMKIKGGAL